MCLVRSTLANLFPIMIHFNALDFNVCRFIFIHPSFSTLYILHRVFLFSHRNVLLHRDGCIRNLFPHGKNEKDVQHDYTEMERGIKT